MSTPRVVAGLTLLAALAVVQQAPASADGTDDRSARTPTGNPTTPRPQVEAWWLKEAARLDARSIVTSRGHVPGKTKNGHTPVQRRPDNQSAKWGREDLTTDALIDFRLNDGICSRLPDGTIQGPSRCEDYLNTQEPRTQQTVQQAVDVIRQQIRQQSVDLPFPKLTVKVQPAERTLVNLDTIVYTDQKEVTTTTLTLLGYPVIVRGTPVSYTWHFGDGSPTLTTTSPGSPYPSKEITHKYLKTGPVKLSVTTNYSALINVAGTGWQPIDGTLPVAGPETPLLVREAVPVLVDPGR